MNLNVGNFKEILKKATFNFSIESVQLKLTEDKVCSSMVSNGRTTVSVLNLPNNILDVKGEEIELNFSEPNKHLMPFLNLIDEESVGVKIDDEKMVISSGRQKSKMFFCSPQVVSTFSSPMRPDIKPFITIDMNEDFIGAISKIKKVGQKFGSVYFNVEKGIFSIETTDKSNRFSNSLKFDLVECEGDDITLKFDYKEFMDAITVMNGSMDTFNVTFYFVNESNRGMFMATNGDESEKYYVMSRTLDQ